MSRRLLTCAACVVASALVLSPYWALAQISDLDELDDATLERDLEAELDDIYDLLDEDAEYPLAQLKAAMLTALGDEGDAGDEDEEEITLAELEQEMAEADTSLEQVVDDALEAADVLASTETPRAWTIVGVSLARGPAAQRRGNGRTTPRQAVLQGTRAIVRTSNAR
jgi:hypothetical protein